MIGYLFLAFYVTVLSAPVNATDVDFTIRLRVLNPITVTEVQSNTTGVAILNVQGEQDRSITRAIVDTDPVQDEKFKVSGPTKLNGSKDGKGINIMIASIAGKNEMVNEAPTLRIVYQ